MPGPFTIVTLKDDNGDGFPMRLPGVYRENKAADIEAALQLAKEEPEFSPNGPLVFDFIEYYD